MSVWRGGTPLSGSIGSHWLGREEKRGRKGGREGGRRGEKEE